MSLLYSRLQQDISFFNGTQFGQAMFAYYIGSATAVQVRDFINALILNTADTKSASWLAATDTFTASGFTPANDTPVGFPQSPPAGLDVNTIYFMVGVSGQDFQLSDSVGGQALDITADGGGTIWLPVILTAAEEAELMSMKAEHDSLTAIGQAQYWGKTIYFSQLVQDELIGETFFDSELGLSGGSLTELQGGVQPGDLFIFKEKLQTQERIGIDGTPITVQVIFKKEKKVIENQLGYLELA